MPQRFGAAVTTKCLAEDIGNSIVQLFFCCDVIRTVSGLVRIRIDSGSENIIDHTIEKIKVNGTEVTPAKEDKSVSLTIPTGKLASKDTVAEADLDAALKEKVNAASEGNHSHANKAFLDTLSGATDEEVTAMCTEVFGA